MPKQNVPALRLEGFSGEWETTTVNVVAEVVGGGTPSTSNPSFWDGDIDWYSPNEVGSDVIAKPSNRRITVEGLHASSAQLLPAHRTILYTSRASIGHTAILTHPAATNQGFQSLVLCDGVDTYFMYSLTPLITRKALKVASGSTFLEISAKALGNIEIPIPPTLEEQQAIGAIFTNLDAAINQHTLKHKSLQQAKTALMQRTFPQEGQTVPELRLKGFDGEWVETSMASIASFNKGTGYSKNDFRATGTPLFHYGRLYTNYQLAVTDVDTFAQVRPGSVLSRGDEVLIPSSGETAEDIATACALLQEGVILGGDLNIVRPTPGYDNVFLALSLSQGATKAELERKAQGKTVVHIHNSDIRSLDVAFPPTLEEQQAIGAVFTQLDTLIAAEAQYIESFKQAKTALLQRMFI